jgi:hypothetical protein
MRFPFVKNDKSPKIVHLETFELPLHIYVEKRRNSRISILKEQINIRLPVFLDESKQAIEMERLLKWASKRIAEQKAKQNFSIPINYWKDRTILFFDGSWTLAYEQIDNSGFVRLNVNAARTCTDF